MTDVTAAIIDDLRARFPGWSTFQSDAGRWWTTRPPMTGEQERAGCSRTVDADSAEQLAERICDEERRASRVEVVSGSRQGK